MTVIAWDGTTLAVDSQSTWNGLTGRVDKLHAVNGPHFTGLVTGCGNSRAISAVLAWFRAGAAADAFPDLGSDKDEVVLITVDTDGAVSEYIGTPHPVSEIAVPYAWGSGRDIAVGAMVAGASAQRAVGIACERSTDCGGPVCSATPGERIVVYSDGRA